MKLKVSTFLKKPRLKLGIREKIIRKGPRAVLFDMDGVLADSSEAWRIAFNDTLKQFGSRQIRKSVYVKKYNKIGTVRGVISAFRKDMHNKRLDENAVAYCNHIFDDLSDEVRLFPGTRNVLMKCKRRFKMALVTNTKRQTVFKILKNLSIEKYFDAVVTIDDVENGKPDPEIIFKACKVLKIKPRKAVIVGDTDADKRTGMASGCKVIGMRLDADDRIEKISELPKKLGLKD